MKKWILIFLIFLFFFSFFFFQEKEGTQQNGDKNEVRGVFISYIELRSYIKGKDPTTGKKSIDQMISKVKKSKFNLIILQVRSFSDAIYPSKIYPWSSTVSKEEGVSPGYDVLQYFIKKAHEENILLYAWINPYRIRTTADTSSITKENPAYAMLNTNSVYINQGIFYNPSKQEVEDLIVSGVEEIVSNYQVDGILFDDYFYPDKNVSLEDYQKTEQNMTIEDFNLSVINQMIYRVHQVCKQHKVLFGVSPDGNISNNYEKNFADVKKWGSHSGYVDFIMPQIYYGFYNETKAFMGVIDEWDQMITKDNISFYIALAFYKVGKVDEYAKSGALEWVENEDIIMREILLSRNLKHYDGFVLFRYDNLYNQDLYTDSSMKEIENLDKILN